MWPWTCTSPQYVFEGMRQIRNVSGLNVISTRRYKNSSEPCTSRWGWPRDYTMLSLDAAHREFQRRALPWTRVRRSHTKPQSYKPEEPPLQDITV
jgi:hypothetical protein